MVTRKKNGAPDSKHYEAPETIAKFEPVKQWLLKNCRKVGDSGRASWKSVVVGSCGQVPAKKRFWAKARGNENFF